MIRFYEKKNRLDFERQLITAMKALLSLPLEIVNVADGGIKSEEGAVGRLIDIAWTEVEGTIDYRAQYTHPIVVPKDRATLVKDMCPDLVLFLGGTHTEWEDLQICKELKIPMIAPKGWSDIGDMVFNEIAWNKKRYFGRKSVARKSSKVAQAFSLFGYLYKDNQYAPYLDPYNIKRLVKSILSLPVSVLHTEQIG